MCTLAEDTDFLFLRKRSLEEYKNVGREVSQRKVNYLLKSVRVLGLNPTGISEEYIDYTQSHHYQEYGTASFYLWTGYYCIESVCVKNVKMYCTGATVFILFLGLFGFDCFFRENQNVWG